MTKQAGGILGRLYLPSKIKIEMKKLNDNDVVVHYIESYDEELPPEAVNTTIEIAKSLGVKARKRGNTFFYKTIGNREMVAGIIMAEFMAQTRLGQITLNEIFALAAMGLPNIQKFASYGSKAK